MEKMQVRFERCKGCGLCVTVCPKQIVALQSTNVDTVSGATYSSVGLISAVRDALQKAGGSSASDSALPILAASESQNKTGENAPAVEAIAEPAAYRDGVYTGTGTGFGGQMTVQVTVSGGAVVTAVVVVVAGCAACFAASRAS